MTKNKALDFHFLDFRVVDIPESTDFAGRLTGKNAKEILIVFQSQNNHEELFSFLEKVLTAAQLNIHTDTLILKITEQEKLSFVYLQKKNTFKYFISFGIAPQRLGIGFETPLYHPVSYEGITLFFADDLQLIYEERQQGGKRMSGELWRVLKSLFI